MPNVPWEFRDLCSTEGLRRSKKVEDTPFDNITFWLSSPSAESAGVCEQLERDSFLKTIAPVDQLRKSVPSAPEPGFTAPKAAGDLVRLANRGERLQKK